MNQKIIQSRAAIVESTLSICKILTSLVNLGVKNHDDGVKNHDDYVKLTASGDYSGDFNKDKTAKMNAQCRASAEAYEPKLTSELAAVEAAGRAMENAEVITDTELSSALAIIESLQGVLPFGVEESLVSTFAGNQKALRIIIGAIQRYGKKTPTLSKYVFEIDSKMTSLRGHISLICAEPYSNGADIMGMRRDLINLCKVIGAEVPEESFYLGDNYDALSDARFRKAAGLPAK